MKSGQKMGEPVKKPILYCGRFAGLTGNILGIFFQLGCGWKGGSARRGVRRGLWLGWTRLVARLGLGVNGSARLKYGARVAQSSSTSGARGMRVVFAAESSGGACGLPPSPMKLILAAVSSS